MTKEPYFRTALREDLAKRQRLNPAYSLRAFAKHLGMQAPTLSAILAGKRPLAMATAETLPEKLSFSPAEKQRFLSSVYYRKADPQLAEQLRNASSAKLLREEMHYKIIAEWEHYALLTLAETRGFKLDRQWIAKRLGISTARAQTSIDLLKEAGMITVDLTGKVRLNQSALDTTDGVPSAALRQSHREALKMGSDKLEQIALEQRDYTSMTIAVSTARLPEAKQLIRDFQRRLSELLEDGPRTEVYQLCVQLYPLTELTETAIPPKNLPVI